MKTFFKLLLILIIGAAIAGAVLYLGNGTNPPLGTSSGDSVGVIINEVMTGNKGIFPDDKGNSSDWVEFYNTTGNDINLGNLLLSDDEKKPQKWVFPSGTVIKAHGYLIVFLSGDSNSNIQEGIIHCTFKLSSQGEKLILSSGASLNKVDEVDIPQLPDNFSYALIGGSWQQTANITPGYENSDAGYEAYKASMSAGESELLVNEVMTSNVMTLTDDKGEYSDWVEITNTGNQDINLNGYGLSDNKNDALKWRFPDITIKAGQQLVVFCTGISRPYTGDGLLSANFKISSYNAEVALSDARGRLIDSVTIGEVPSDWVYERVYQNGAPTGQWLMASTPSPGYPNTGAGFAEFEKNNPASTGDVVISEVLSSNNKYDTADGGKSDFIEVENRGTNAVNLQGFGLTDNASNPSKFRFPDVTLQPGDHLAVLANGTSNTNGNYYSAPFKLSKLGCTVALFDAQDQLLDRYFLGALPQNLSIGRAEGSTEIAYFEPTPGQANRDAKSGFVSDVQFDKQPGKYDGTIQLSLSSSEGSAIYYTTDGNEPTQSSKQYTGPITIDKTTAIRAKAFKQGYIESGMATATYFINTSKTLPMVSITTEYDKLFDPATGIYANSKKDVEVPASFELYNESGQRVFQQDIGLAMTGGMTLQLKEQKSFAIYARGTYGKGTMAYPFFDNRPYTEYKSVILRTAGRDDTDTKLSTYVAMGLVDGKMEVLTQAAEPCVVYIDGEYWGIYFLMEKRNKYMVAQHEGITDPAAIDSINLAKGLRENLTSSGSYKGYEEIYNYAKSHDLSVQEYYDWVAARLDTDSYMDFMINEIYIANNDVKGNMQYYQVPGGLWRQIYLDLDIAFYPNDTVALRMRSDTAGSDIFNALLENDDWRKRFIKRFAWALENIYNTDHAIAVIDEAASLIRGEVEADHSRWSDERPTLQDWESGITRMKNFVKKRGQAVINELKQQFDLTQEQIQMLNDAIK